MQFAGYDQQDLLAAFKKQLAVQEKAGAVSAATAQQLASEYEAGAARGTYLE
jgi:arginine decarboxylase-like protein